jgi:4-hydroxy-tetrahydrodipicolinate synthase
MIALVRMLRTDDALRMDLSGLWIPLVTPFDRRGEVDHGALRTLAGDVLADGADGLVALGTTGEAAALDDDERAAVVATCASVAVARGAGLIVSAGTNDTRTTVARHRALAGVAGVVASLAVVPYYVRPSEAAVVAHLQHVAARSPVPVVVYNVPHRTGRGLGAASLLELAGTPDVVGVKQSVSGLDADTLHLLARAPAGFSVLAGDDPFLLPVLLLGGRGGITASAHLATDRFRALVADARAGRVAAARDRSARLLPLVDALFAEPNPAVLKAVLHAQGRIPTAAVRMPLAPAGADARDRALAALAAA